MRCVVQGFGFVSLLALCGCEAAEPLMNADDGDARIQYLSVDEVATTPCGETGEGTYEEVGEAVGIDFRAPMPDDSVELLDFDFIMGGGGAAIDVTGDDLPDLVFTAVWGDNAVFRNDGDGTFTRCEDSGLEWGDRTYGVSAIDLDGDGLREVVLLDATELRLFHNDGDCRFTERRPIHRIANSRTRPMNLAWADYDHDGRLDVYVSMRDSAPLPPESNVPAPDVLLQGRDDLGFLDVSVQLGPTPLRSGHAFMSSWMDVDHDGDLDLYVANDHGAKLMPNALFLREGTDDAPTFREAASEFALDIGINGMGIAVGDVDGDGWDEIGVSDTANFVVLSTRPDGPAVDVTTAWGLVPRSLPALASWGMELADVDHDADLDLLVSWGWKEFHRVTPNRDDLWLWEDGSFIDGGDRLGFQGQPNGRTLMPVDLDGDGCRELVATSLTGAPSIQRRPCPDGRWIEIGFEDDLVAVGARVEIEVDGVARHRRVGIGSTGVHSAREPVAHFGLGSADAVDVLRVELPDGRRGEASNLPAGARYRVAFTSSGR